MRETLFADVKAYLREYCLHTSVHGFQYFGERKRTVFERIWWIIVFISCLTVCTVSIYAVYHKWSLSPVIVNFANKGTPIYTIPFPSVTVCPESKSSRQKFNFTDVMQKNEDGIPLTESEEVRFRHMSLICNHNSGLNYTQNETFSGDFHRIVDELKPSITIQNCTILNQKAPCEELFVPIMTDQGICYTFNMIDRDLIFRENVIHYANFHKIDSNVTQWSLQDGYSENAGLEPYPYRAYLSGAKYGFTFNVVTLDEDLDFWCTGGLQGYRVVLHTPMTLPRPSQKYFRLPLDQSITALINPLVITTSDTVKMYNAKKRKCYFSEERYLQYFRDYSSSSCKLECLTNYTLALCGCVNFYMPRDNTTEICGVMKISCMKWAEEFMYTLDLTLKLETNATYVLPPDVTCDCLPVCSDLTYNTETSQSEWEWEKWLQARRSLLQIKNKSHVSSLTLFFGSDTFISSERNELYGPTDFLANFGGLLGLFTGFSALSLMEIVYFFTVRIICNLKLHGRWVGLAE